MPTEVVEKVVSIRRDIHSQPELSFEEYRTADLIASELEELGLKSERVAGTGVVADMGTDGPRVALRADLDALPIPERTGLPFASKVNGVMHACGHDAHTAMLLGATIALTSDPPLNGRVRFIFQPAEERGGGALQMIEGGALDEVHAIFGQHVDRHYKPGQIAISDGPMSAYSDSFEINIRGGGGHGARPHEAVDVVVVAGILVTTLQTVVSREVNPAEPVVLTIGTINAGSATNTIAEEADLTGTIRAASPEGRAAVTESIKRITSSVAEIHGAVAEIQVHEGYPRVMNDSACETDAKGAAKSALGHRSVRDMPFPNMGSEDFGYYLEHVPGAYIRLGARKSGAKSHPAHSSRFDIDERALGAGSAYMAEVARQALARLSS